MSKIEEFLRLYEGKGTYNVYRWAIGEFFKTVNADSDHYFTEQRNYEEDIKNFLLSLNGKAPKTVRLMISVVKSFLIENKIELPERFWRRLKSRIKGHRALTVDKVPSNEELRRILSHTSIHGKALFLTLSSSGMRIGEALSLDKDEDIDLSKTPAVVTIRGNHSKTGNSRITFISREAKEAIQEWLKVRDNYLAAAVLKSTKKPHYKAKFLGKNPDDQRLFPFEVSTAHYIWTQAVNKAGFLKKDAQTNRHTLHIHVLRKFFRSKMATLIPVDVTEALMGHEGYLTDVYRRYSQADLAKFYLQGEESLLVYGQGDITAFREDLQKVTSTIESKLNTENARLEKEIESLKDADTKMKEKVESLEEQVKTSRRILNDLAPIIENVEKLAPILEKLRKREEEEKEKAVEALREAEAREREERDNILEKKAEK